MRIGKGKGGINEDEQAEKHGYI